jgi:hypothetical protein
MVSEMMKCPKGSREVQGISVMCIVVLVKKLVIEHNIIILFDVLRL